MTSSRPAPPESSSCQPDGRFVSDRAYRLYEALTFGQLLAGSQRERAIAFDCVTEINAALEKVGA